MGVVQSGAVGSRLHRICGQALTGSGPDFLCFCGFLPFPLAAPELCIGLTFHYPKAG